MLLFHPKHGNICVIAIKTLKFCLEITIKFVTHFAISHSVLILFTAVGILANALCNLRFYSVLCLCYLLMLTHWTLCFCFEIVAIPTVGSL